jgi:hypothetical protein
MSKQYINIAAFDFGKVNFAFYTERISISKIKELSEKYKNLPNKFKRIVKGDMNKYIEEILEELYLDGTRVEDGMGVFDIRQDKESQLLDFETRINMHQLLSKHEHIWDECDIIVLEQQYYSAGKSFKKKGNFQTGSGGGVNMDAIKLAECCLNWFLMKYGRFKEITFFGSVYKTETLGAPEKLTKPQRKKWSITKTLEILEKRGDVKAIELMNGKKNSKGKKQKMDDISDCLTMLQAYKFRKLIVE